MEWRKQSKKMSISRRFDLYNEDCVVSFASEGDERIHMPLCGVTDCLPGYRIARRDSLEWVFECVVRGKGYLRVDGQEYRPKAGDVYIVNFGSDHEYGSDDDDPWEKIWFNVRGTLVEDLVRIYNLESTRYLPNCGMEAVFRECLQLMRGNPERAHETATLVTHRLLYHLSRAIAERGRIPEAARRLKHLLDENVASAVSLGELAERYGKSVSQAHRIFRAAYGASPYAYVLERRLELAKVMLANSAATVKDIAGRTGFSDPYYFSNLFKRKFGVAPRHFRQGCPRLRVESS